MIRKIAAAAAAAVFFISAPFCQAVDGIAFEYGRGDDRTNLLRAAIVDFWRAPQPQTPDWRLAGYWEISAGIWDNADESTADIGVTPVFRVQRKRFYVEGAIGAHLVQTHISAQRSFSTALQFGTHVGVGIHSGKYDFGLRVQHLSNSGIESPNPGINFVLVRLQYALE